MTSKTVIRSVAWTPWWQTICPTGHWKPKYRKTTGDKLDPDLDLIDTLCDWQGVTHDRGCPQFSICKWSLTIVLCVNMQIMKCVLIWANEFHDILLFRTFYIANCSYLQNMPSEASDEDRKSPRVHNACYYPELTTFDPEVTQEIRRLNCSITVQMVSFNHDMPLQIPFTVFNNSLVSFSYRRQLRIRLMFMHGFFGKFLTHAQCMENPLWPINFS